MATILDHLRELRDLLSDPKKHTTGVFARDAKNRVVMAGDESAVCWCLLGGVFKTCPKNSQRLVLEALHGALPKSAVDDPDIPESGLSKFNDAHPDKVLPLIDRAIEREAS